MTRARGLLAALAALLALAAPAAQADDPPPPPTEKPALFADWATQVSTTSANLRAEINPGGLPTTYRFEYTTEADFLENEFADATRIPSGTEASIGEGTATIAVVQHPGAFAAGTSYRYRIVASNELGTTTGPTRPLTTDELTRPFSLPDARGWEMVSPIEKNGGEVQNFGGNLGGGVIQAAAGGGSFTYTSSASFGTTVGDPGTNQYISTRGGSGWGTENVTLPSLSGTYPESPASGVPYQVFSSDLLGALVSNGRRCRVSTLTQCPVENPPLAGSGAPAGYRNYYLRDNSDGTFAPVLSTADLGTLALGPEHFEAAIAGTTPDLSQIVLSTCAALTPGSTEVAGSEGECDPKAQNLYRRVGGALQLVNVTLGATLAAQSRAISTDGSRIYWTSEGNLFLRDGSQVKRLDESQGGGGVFQTASSDGSVAFFTKGGHLYRYLASGGTTTDLTPGGGVQGVLGGSDDGSRVYYLDASGVALWDSGTTIPVAAGADADSYPPTTGTARVSADGRRLVFVSSAELTIYENRGFDEVYVYTEPQGGAGGSLLCASCNPSGERPIGAASLPGASVNGTGLNLPHSYKPRVLSADSRRLFFDTTDALVPRDTNGDGDVYQWEEPGTGSCAKAIPCVELISSGRAENGASFLDASSDGSNAFFLTDGSLIPADPGAADVYDARVNGGFPPPVNPIPCFGDACQPLPAEPEDPTPGTLRTKKSSGNVPPAPPKKALKCKRGKVKRFGKCVRKPKPKRGGRR